MHITGDITSEEEFINYQFLAINDASRDSKQNGKRIRKEHLLLGFGGRLPWPDYQSNLRFSMQQKTGHIYDICVWMINNIWEGNLG